MMRRDWPPFFSGKKAKCQDVGHEGKNDFYVEELQLVQDGRGHYIYVCEKCRRNYPVWR